MQEISYPEAVSFPGTQPPDGAKEFAREFTTTLGVVIYYKVPDSDTIYYATKKGQAFAAKMEELIKRDKKEKHRFH